MSDVIALFRNEPEDVYARALELGPFVRRVCLFSGGRDSLTTALRCRDLYDELVFIDTGTAIPGVREHVERAAAWIGKPLRVYETPATVYDELVIKLRGFPGPAQHNRCYNQLKERRLREMLREFKAGDRNARVLALSGVRRAESSRRAKRQEVTRQGALVFCNPLIDWTAADLREFMAGYPDAPQSDVTALLCRSGECQCGAMATEGEREELLSLFPQWFAERIAPLERLCLERGYSPATWGPGRVSDEPVPLAGELCSDCQLRWEVAA